MHNALKALFPLVVLAAPVAAFAAEDPIGTVTVAGPQYEVKFTPAQLADLPHVTVKVTVHDVEHSYSGVKLIDLLKQVGAPTGADIRGAALADVVLAHSRDGYEVALALTETDARYRAQPVILADHVDGKAMDDNEGPIRLIVPGDIEPARSSKQLDKVTLRLLASPPAR